MTKKEEFDADGCLFVLAAPAIIAGSMMLNAWAVSLLWGWFLTPQFGIAVPSFKTLMGISLISAFYRGKSYRDKDESPWRHQIESVILTLLTVLIGWLVMRFA